MSNQNDWADELARRLKRAADRAARAAGSGRGPNVFSRVNRAAAINVGARGGTRYASSTQNVRIVQNGETIVEESETITDTN